MKTTGTRFGVQSITPTGNRWRPIVDWIGAGWDLRRIMRYVAGESEPIDMGATTSVDRAVTVWLHLQNRLVLRSQTEMTTSITAPTALRGHRDPALLGYKQLHLFDPHVEPLNRLADDLSNRCPERVPYFDPLDGGIEAKLLFVSRSPVLGAEESGFVSRDNDDAAAANMFYVCDQAGIPREQTALWNIVPWFARPPFRKADLQKGAEHLSGVLRLFVDLRVVIFGGAVARKGSAYCDVRVPVVHSLSTGAQSRISNPNFREIIIDDLANAWAEYC